LYDRQSHLLQIALAGRAARAFAGAAEDREKNRWQESYYSYDNKQFNKCEAVPGAPGGPFLEKCLSIHEIPLAKSTSRNWHI
jgi:hypothetical protein